MDKKDFSAYLAFRDSGNAFFGALHQPMTEALTKFFEEEEANQDADGILAQIAVGAAPEEVDLKELLKRSPYGNPQQFKVGIEKAAERGWIIATEKGFKATDKAKKMTDKLVDVFLKDSLAAREEGISVDIGQACALLSELVEAAGVVEAFDYRPSYTFARNYEYADKTPSLLWVRRHLITLNAYRDDCHIASWIGYDLPGYEWETLSFIWEGEAESAAELAEKLSFRTYEEADYQKALDSLVGRGWVAAADGKYQLTEQGKEVREKAEKATNKYYKAAFKKFSPEMLAELTGLVQQLTEEITIEQDEE